MKCSKCGREFGDGANCQNCGVDRVTGLGNYSGYNRPSGSSEPHYSSSNNGGYASNTMVCYACNEIIPANSEFCPYCCKKLYVKCPKCGHTYSSQFPACNKCGTNREKYNIELEERRKEDKKKEEAKKKAVEEDHKIQNDARGLKTQIQGNYMVFWFLFSFSLSFLSFILIIVTTENASVALLSFFVCIIIALFGGQIVSDKDANRIEKWKQEHPNDPRNKYL